MREGIGFGGLHLEDIPERVREIVEHLEKEADIQAITVKLRIGGHHKSYMLEIVDVDRSGDTKMEIELDRILCHDCGHVFYTPRPPVCFPGQVPQATHCPYCSGENLEPFEITKTVVRAPVPEPRNRPASTD